MPINVVYGDVGPYLGYAYRAAQNEQMNKNNAIRAQQDADNLRAQAAMTAAMAHGEAVRQRSIDETMQQEAANSRDSADNQTKANLLGTQEQFQVAQDQRQNLYLTLRDRNLNQMRVQADVENDARTELTARRNRLIQQGVPLAQDEKMEMERLGTQLSRIDQSPIYSDDDKVQMRRPLEQRFGYLQDRYQASMARSDHERTVQANRNWAAALIEVHPETGQIKTEIDPNAPITPGFVRAFRDQHGSPVPIRVMDPRPPRPTIPFADFNRAIQDYQLNNPGSTPEQANEFVNNLANQWQQGVGAIMPPNPPRPPRPGDPNAPPRDETIRPLQTTVAAELRDASTRVETQLPLRPAHSGHQQVRESVSRPRNPEAVPHLQTIDRIVRTGRPFAQLPPADQQSLLQALALLPEDVARRITFPPGYLPQALINPGPPPPRLN